MKKFKEVDIDRRNLRSANTNTTHRASLIVPEIPGNTVEISFLNHFLLKRNQKNIGCRITSVDHQGNRIGSELTMINDPKVYTFNLSRIAPQKAAMHLVEFYTGENIYVPFPAVMINHWNSNFVNQVHTCSRILNDVFENDAINKVHVKEASVDLQIDDDTDTFFLFTTGQLPCAGVIKAEIVTEKETLRAEKAINLGRFSSQTLTVQEIFNHKLPKNISGVLKFEQPQQFMLYSRLLAGQIKKDGSFTANHSYYDNSTFEEYWDNTDVSTRAYPFLNELENKFRMYPIFSPTRLDISIEFHRRNGDLLKTLNLGRIETPSAKYLDYNLNQLLKNAQVDITQVESFNVVVHSLDNKIPTRLCHQLIYGAGGLDSSINESIMNPNEIFVPEDRKGITWGQIAVGNDYTSYLGIVRDPLYDKYLKTNETFELELYNTEGKFFSKTYEVKSCAAVNLNLTQEFKSSVKDFNAPTPSYVWFNINCPKPGIFGFGLTKHNRTKHCSGEHGF